MSKFSVNKILQNLDQFTKNIPNLEDSDIGRICINNSKICRFPFLSNVVIIFYKLITIQKKHVENIDKNLPLNKYENPLN